MCLAARLPEQESILAGRVRLTKVLRNRRGLEVLIRKLLNLPSRPAVLMLNLWMPSFNRYSYWEARRPSFVPVHRVPPFLLTKILP